MAVKKTNKITKALVISYIVLSAIFILLSFLSYLKNGVYVTGYDNGKNDTLNGVMGLATNKECNTFTVNVGNAGVDLINIACLQKAPENSED